MQQSAVYHQQVTDVIFIITTGTIPVCLEAVAVRGQLRFVVFALLTVCTLYFPQQQHQHFTHVAVEDVGLVRPQGQVVGCG